MRAIVAVFASVVLISIGTLALSLAPWFLFGVDGVTEAGTFATTPTYNVYAIAAAVLMAFLGGRLCATIARSRAAVIVLAAIALAGSLGSHFNQHHKPDPGPRLAPTGVMAAVLARKEPDWFTLLTMGLGPTAVLIGGRGARPGAGHGTT